MISLLKLSLLALVGAPGLRQANPEVVPEQQNVCAMQNYKQQSSFNSFAAFDTCHISEELEKIERSKIKKYIEHQVKKEIRHSVRQSVEKLHSVIPVAIGLTAGVLSLGLLISCYCPPFE